MTPNPATMAPLPARQDYQDEAELCVLGAMMVNPGAVPIVREIVSGEDFYATKNALIFKAILAVSETAEPDQVTVAGELERRNQIEQAGGRDYLHVLVEFVPAAANAAHYAEMVREASIRRRMARATTKLSVAIDAHNITSQDAAFAEIEELRAARAASTQRAAHIYTAPEFSALSPEHPDYLVFGYVICGGITELDAKIKTGKTTFVLDMVRSICEGDDFLGHATKQCNVLYLTEEGNASFKSALRRVGVADQKRLHILPRRETQGMTWPEICSMAGAYCAEHEVGLVIADTLAHWIGRSTEGAENDASMADADMRPLRELANSGPAVIVCRHEGKDPTKEVGDSARGSTAYGGAVDIIVSLRKQRGNAKSHKRDLHAMSRFDDTPEAVVVEFKDGHYVMLGDPETDAIRTNDQIIYDHVPIGRMNAASRDAIHEDVRIVQTISDVTMHRSLEHLVAAGRVLRERGVGSVSLHAYGYWIPGPGDEEQERFK